MLLFLFIKNDISSKKLMNCEIKVAIAAPETPKFNVKINIGSRTILMIDPEASPNMANAALPSALKILFITNDVHIMGAPKSMYFA